MATGKGKTPSRETRERARLYQARQQYHAAGIARRRRDDLIAGIAGGVLIVGILVGQAMYFTAGPGAPAPVPTSTPSPAPTP